MTLEENFNNSKNILISKNIFNESYFNLRERLTKASKTEIIYLLNHFLLISSKLFKENVLPANRIRWAFKLNSNSNIGSRIIFQILFRKILKYSFKQGFFEKKLIENKNEIKKKNLFLDFCFRTKLFCM